MSRHCRVEIGAAPGQPLNFSDDGWGAGRLLQKGSGTQRKGVFITLVNTAQNDLFAGEDEVFGNPKLVLCCPLCY